MANGQAIGQILKAAGKNIPWKKIAAFVGPMFYDPVKDKVSELIAKIGKPSTSKKLKLSLDGLDQRVTNIEQLNLENAKLVSELEKRQELNSQVIQTLSARVIILTIVTGMSFIISLLTLILLLLRR